MRNILILIISIFIGFISCAEQNGNDIYYTLCGVWDHHPNFKKTETKYSWGKAVEVMVQGSLIIELGDKVQYIQGPIRGCPIVAAKKIGDKRYSLTIAFPDKNEYDLIINLNENDSIWFEKMDWFSKAKFIGRYGKDNPYYKISGPEKKDNPYYKTTVDDLRFRAAPGEDGIFLRMLKKGERLNLLQKGPKETIDGVEGTWVQVHTDKGEIGWCFDAYLEEVK